MNTSNTTWSLAVLNLVLPPDNSTIDSTWISATFLGVSVLLNVPIFFTIVFNKEMRRRPEMVALTNVSAWESVYGFTFFWLNAKTIALAPLGVLKVGMTQMECLLQFYNVGLAYATAAMNTSILLLAVDRLTCVLFFNFYRKFHWAYISLVIMAPFVPGLTEFLIYYCGSLLLKQTPTVHPSSCTLSRTTLTSHRWAKDLYLLSPLSIATVLIYVTAIIALTKKKKSIFANLEAQERQRQRKVNRFFALLALITAATMFGPRLLSVLMQNLAYDWWTNVGGYYSSFVEASHSLLYGIVFWTRKSDIREAFLKRIGLSKLVAFGKQHSTTVYPNHPSVYYTKRNVVSMM